MAEPDRPDPRRVFLASCRALLGRSLDVCRRFEPGTALPREARRATAHLQLAMLALEELEAADPDSIDAWAERLTARLFELDVAAEPADPDAPSARSATPVAGAPGSPTSSAPPTAPSTCPSTDPSSGSDSVEVVSDVNTAPPSITVDRATAGEPDLQGDTTSFPMPELLGFLQMQEKSGRLELVTETERFLIVLDRGILTHAASDATPDHLRLGEILVALGAISRVELLRFLQRNRGSRTRLGEALAREELVDHRTLRGALSHQVQELFHRLFRARHARFAFWEGGTEDTPNDLGLNVIQLLLESARFHDEHESG